MTRTLLLLLGTALATGAPALAQTSIGNETAGPLRTSETGELTVEQNGAVTLAAPGSAIVMDGDADVTVLGTVTVDDADDSNGIEARAGGSGDLTVAGNLFNREDRPLDNADDDADPDGAFAAGSGRTGILISGAGTFTGNVLSTSSANISVEGNDSAAVRLASGTRLDGDLRMGGAGISVLGDRSRGLDIRGTMSGDVSTDGAIGVQGEGATAVAIAGDVDGGYTNTASITNSGYRFASRPQQQSVRDDLDADDLLQGGSAVQVNGNVAGGLFFQRFLDEEGRAVAVSSVTQAGGAPAVLVDGAGTPIAIGVVAEITDAAAEGFDAGLQYAFINQGTLAANGVYDDVGATTFEVREATLTGGINNVGSMTATAIRTGFDGTPDAEGFDGAARVIILGDAAIAERINNTGIITASVSEDRQSVFADRANVIAPRELRAVAIDIAATAELASLTNRGVISALLTGREGEAVVVRDASGTLSTIDNSGLISAIGSNSDTLGLEATAFNLVALDLRENTVGVRITQTQDADNPGEPRIDGDVILGSGDDVLDVRAGSVIGDIDFGAGADVFRLEDADYLGRLRDQDRLVTLTVTGDSTLALLGGSSVGVTEATFGAGTTFRPSLYGQNGTASTLVASGGVSFADGARVSPIIETFVDGSLSRFAIARGSSLEVGGDLASLAGEFSPFLYTTSYELDADTNTLFVNLSLRDAEALGLDGAQASALPAAFTALGANPELAQAVINIDNEGEFNAAFNQLLPELGAAARQFILASTDGAVGAVASHLAQARRSQERTGGAWLQQYGYFADRDLSALSEQYRGQGFGFSGGIDSAFGPFHAVGVNVGFSTSEIEDVVGQDDPMDVQTLQAGLYAAMEMGRFGIESYFGGGYSNLDISRLVGIGDFTSRSAADYDASHINSSVRAGFDVPLGERFWARPVVSLDYLRLSEDGYDEDGALGIGLRLDGRTTETMATSAMLNLGAEFNGRRTWIRPAIRAGYRKEYLDDVITSGFFRGLDTPFALTAGEFPDEALILGLSVAAGSDYSSVGFDLDSDIRDGFVRHTGRIVVRLLF